MHLEEIQPESFEFVITVKASLFVYSTLLYFLKVAYLEIWEIFLSLFDNQSSSILQEVHITVYFRNS